MATLTAQQRWQSPAGEDFLQLVSPNGQGVVGNIDSNGSYSALSGSTASVFKTSNTTVVATGTIYALRGRSENHVASMTGTVSGVSGYAANYAASASGNINAGEFVALTKGVAIGTARAVFAQIDGGGGASTATEVVCVSANNQYAGTATSGPFAFEAFDNSDANASGLPFAAILRVAQNSASALIGPIIDATGVTGYATSYAGVTLTTHDVPLFAYKDSSGVAHVLVVVANNSDIAIRT